MKTTLMPTNLKLLRFMYGKTQKDISIILNLSLVQYAKKENGKASFSLSEAKKLSEYFEISIEKIFFSDNTFTLRTQV
jgi:transcriptional regulator with XRE-family HTH domain